MGVGGAWQWSDTGHRLYPVIREDTKLPTNQFNPVQLTNCESLCGPRGAEVLT